MGLNLYHPGLHRPHENPELAQASHTPGAPPTALCPRQRRARRPSLRPQVTGGKLGNATYNPLEFNSVEKSITIKVGPTRD